ncbi:MAG: type II toxin-antitoxin system RelE/ParE family toxin [Spirochaetaceae bacterium]
MKWPPAHEDARRDFDDLVDHLHETASRTMARRFVSEAMKAVQRARRNPMSGSPRSSGVRRKRIGRFACDLVYLPEEHDIYIVAFAHHRREPGYWRRRLR